VLGLSPRFLAPAHRLTTTFHNTALYSCNALRNGLHYKMIRPIRHKGLRRLYEGDDPRGVMAEHAAKLRDILARLRIWTCRAVDGIDCRAG